MIHSLFCWTLSCSWCHLYQVYLLHFIIINISNVLWLSWHLSGLKNFPAILNNCSAGAEVAGTHNIFLGKACQMFVLIVVLREFKMFMSRHPTTMDFNFVLTTTLHYDKQLRTQNLRGLGYVNIRNLKYSWFIISSTPKQIIQIYNWWPNFNPRAIASNHE